MNDGVFANSIRMLDRWGPGGLSRVNLYVRQRRLLAAFELFNRKDDWHGGEGSVGVMSQG